MCRETVVVLVLKPSVLRPEQMPANRGHARAEPNALDAVRRLDSRKHIRRALSQRREVVAVLELPIVLKLRLYTDRRVRVPVEERVLPAYDRRVAGRHRPPAERLYADPRPVRHRNHAELQPQRRKDTPRRPNPPERIDGDLLALNLGNCPLLLHVCCPLALGRDRPGRTTQSNPLRRRAPAPPAFDHVRPSGLREVVRLVRPNAHNRRPDRNLRLREACRRPA